MKDIYLSNYRYYCVNQKCYLQKFHNKFQNALRNDMNFIKKSRNIFIFADKTRTIYETDKGTYLTLLNDNMTKIYRKSSNTFQSEISKGAKQIANDYEIADRIDSTEKVDVFISLKAYSKV